MKDLQKRIKSIYKDNNWNTPPELLLIAIQEELGEICASFLADDPRYKKAPKDIDSIEEEIGDLILLIFAFCNKMDIDPEEWVENTIKKMEKREHL
jgi:NTP pyrophosphatase (non-canonical NTP hydrolase)